jgi:hypothetical protein
MRSRTRRAPDPTAVGEASNSASELTIHLGLSAPGDLRSGDDDKVEAGTWRRREPTEALSQQPTSPVAGDGSSDLPAHGEAQSVLEPLVRQRDHEEEAASQSSSLSEDTIELRACPQPPDTPETPLHDPSGSSTIRQPAASGPSADAASGSRGHPSSAFGPGSRGSASASDCWVETSSSCWFPSLLPAPRWPSHQDKLKRVAEKVRICQRKAGSSSCAVRRLYASVTGLRTAKSVKALP